MQNFDPDRIRRDLDEVMADIDALKGVADPAAIDSRFDAIEQKLSHALAILAQVEPLLVPLARQLATEIAGVGAVETAGVLAGETVGVHSDAPADHPPADPHGD